MFKLFSKKSNTTKDCYLLSSNVLADEVLNDKDIEDYDKHLSNPDIDSYLKEVIRWFLKPYKISFLKWTLNDDYFRTPFPVDLKYNHSYIAPTLRKIKQDSTKRAMGYPNWFYAAFPDVLEWAAGKTGGEYIVNLFSKYSEEELVENNELRFEVLIKIVDSYIEKTKKPLECKKY